LNASRDVTLRILWDIIP